MFYSSIVVYIATDLFGAFDQGHVTARVMLWLNGLGTVTILLLVADCIWQKKHFTLPKGMVIVVAGLIVCQGFLWWLREAMVNNVDYTEAYIQNRKLFRNQHEWYMRLTTALWLLSMIYMGWLIRRKDTAKVVRQPDESESLHLPN